MTGPRLLAFLATLPVVLAAADARGSDPAAAQTLYDEGRRLLAEGRVDEACPKFEQSQRLDPGIGTKFHLADCLQRQGRTSTAWTLFQEVAAEAAERSQGGRARVARERAEALAPHVPKLAITPHDSATLPGFTIVRDGVQVGPSEWGTPVPVDPGTHLIAAHAPGKQPWIFQVDVAPDQAIVTVDVPALNDVAPPPPPPPPPAPPPPPPIATGPAGFPIERRAPGVTEVMARAPHEGGYAADRSGDGQRAIGWSIAGVGLASFAVGTYFGVKWLDDRNRADARCIPVCNVEGNRLRNDARTNGIAAAGLAGGGAAAMLIGVAIVASAPSQPSIRTGTARGDVVGHAKARAGTVHFVPSLGPGGGGLLVLGSF
ncbi:MAG: hypothetical protein FWD17_01935 [Polyangiaceae bacterium]|nr:hypothetical protein [Polyangiaceae bacterium]